MKAEKITILNNKQEKLVGYFYKNTSKTLIVLCHGAEPFNGYPGIEGVFEFYYSTGASVFAFDFSGHGGSEGENVISFKQRDADIKSVLDHFSTKYKEIILYGASLAGVSVAIAAGRYKTVAKLITVNGFFVFNPRFMYPRLVFIVFSYLISHPKFWKEVYFAINNLKMQKIKVPTLVIYGDKDDVVKPNQSIHFYNKLNTKKELFVFKNGDHPLMKKEYLKVAGPILDWIKQQIVFK
jgi:alpha-beta hydrolase superfamily lysophospholipase